MGTLGRGAHAVDWPPMPTSGPGLVRTSVSRAATLSPTTSPVAVIPNHPPSYVPVKPRAHALEGGADLAEDAEADGDLLEAGEEAVVAVVLGDASEHEGDQGRALRANDTAMPSLGAIPTDRRTGWGEGVGSPRGPRGVYLDA